MRVIGGERKGRRLLVPKGQAVRPTAARVKESLFNILPHDFTGMTVLDLFAGTGNLSIEALSRGAQHAVLVDRSARSAAAIRENLRRVGLTARAEVWAVPVTRALKSLAKRGEIFDMIFLDPPYDQGMVEPSLNVLAQGILLSDAGTVVAEHSRRDAVSRRYGPLVLHDQRRYGDTLLSFFKHETTINPDP